MYEDKTIKNGERITESYNPATGEHIGSIRENTIEELNEAVSRAGAAQKEWAKKSFGQRKKHILNIRDYITLNADRIAETISKDSGKTKMDALSTEVMSAAMAANWYAKKTKKYLKRKKIPAGNILLINKRSYLDRVPWGVVGIISPWNYPFGIPMHEIFMGLMAGNAVILKAASQSQEVSKIITECVEAAELPEGLFVNINMPGSKAGEALINSGISKLFFTGSVPVGKKLMEMASKRLLPLSLELGGNDAMIVCHDANIFRAAGGALWAGYSNAGQSCAGVERIYVEEPVYDEFVSTLKEMVNSLRQGDGSKLDMDMGSLTTAGQLETVKTHIKDAKDKGADVFMPDHHKTGDEKIHFHPAAVVENLTEDMLLMKEETFGPVVAVTKVKNVDEALEKANNSNLGLTASVWTRSSSKGKYIADRLEAGAVMINDHLMSHGLAETPWGGFKQSGLERTHSFLGLEAMTQPHTVVNDIMPGVQKNMWWFPYSEKVYEGLKGVLNFLYGKNKISNGFKLVRVFMRTFSKKFQ